MTSSAKKTKSIKRKKLQDEIYNAELSPINRYKQKSVGDISFVGLFRYELANLLVANLGGGLGYYLRRLFWDSLFCQLGSDVIIGKGVVIRHPGRISIGKQVAIDDYVLLDGSGAGSDGVHLGDRVIISRNCIIQGKSGPVVIQNNADIGANTIITSVSGINLDPSVLIAGNCYIGGSRYFTEHLNTPIMEQGWYSRGPVQIGAGSWLGAGVIVLDGTRIGKGCIVGAGATVTKDIPDFAVAIGVPAKVIGFREQAE